MSRGLASEHEGRKMANPVLEQEDQRIVDMPEEWAGVIPSEVFLEEAQRIVEEGEKQGLILRVMGGVGIRLHTMELAGLAQRLGRLGEGGQQEFTDLDFMSYRKQRDRIKALFVDTLGYDWRRPTISSSASQRRIYFHPKGWFFVDVFWDQLKVANHPLDFRGRLELDSPTLTPTDFCLEKLQIVNFAGKDLKDALIILIAHEVGESDAPETINGRYIAKLLARDWGFWYTVTTNLDALREIIPTLEVMTEAERATALSRIEAVRGLVDDAPKSLGWKSRAIIGPRKRWYEPVETTDTVGDFGIWRLRERIESE
jgi:hypothetical protein